MDVSTIASLAILVSGITSLAVVLYCFHAEYLSKFIYRCFLFVHLLHLSRLTIDLFNLQIYPWPPLLHAIHSFLTDFIIYADILTNLTVFSVFNSIKRHFDSRYIFYTQNAVVVLALIVEASFYAYLWTSSYLMWIICLSAFVPLLLFGFVFENYQNISIALVIWKQLRSADPLSHKKIKKIIACCAVSVFVDVCDIALYLYTISITGIYTNYYGSICGALSGFRNSC